MDNMSFEELLNSTEEVAVYPGKIVDGEIIQYDNDGIYVNFGYRYDGFIPYYDWSVTMTVDEIKKSIKEGNPVRAMILKSLRKTHFVRMSRVKVFEEDAWKNIAPLNEGERRRTTVIVREVVCKNYVDIVGLSVTVEGVEGFMPASHVELRHVDDFEPYIGQKLEAEIIEIDFEKKRIVVSRRGLLKAKRTKGKADVSKAVQTTGKAISAAIKVTEEVAKNHSDNQDILDAMEVIKKALAIAQNANNKALKEM